MSENVVEELTGLVDEMKSEESFNLLDAVQEVSYPTGSVVVYTNGELAVELNDLIAERGAIEAIEAQQGAQSLSNPELADLDIAIADLKDEIHASQLTFHMRGVAPAVKRAIAKKARAKFKVPKNADEFERNELWLEENDWTTYEIIAHAITKVVNAKGAVDKSGKRNEDVRALSERLAESEFQKLDLLCAKLSSASQLFSETLDADFLPKPSADQ
jgi:hypothetical protein